MSRLKVITLCSGYDAQCLALQRLGIDFDLWWSEIDKYAIQAHNVLRLGEGCLTDVQFSQQTLMAAFAKPLLCAGRFISTKFNLKTK